ncbi:UvrD-helicase domain-containing protein [Shewanella sp. MBTL60-007]|uniref:UvrD-helicase domain-containing protein n=1 Tax=Shewanella sp. MBTL60-007 TaxID=2815911 RepID=UPI001BC0C3E3|nr:UvrD-helicase domain-containing protein [Shewanella sp. MBTL60-007]GIU32507.1 DNA helicase [Shewanella sp. MBTL60-007]
MTAEIIHGGNERDAGVVEEICGYLTETPPRSYFLFAGAGSGKTRTLVEVLRRLTDVVPHESGSALSKSFRMFGRSIRVITYTKNAVAVINGRLGNNDLVKVSTIHSFCWELIDGFNDDIREALIAIKLRKLNKEQTKASEKAKGINDKDRGKFAEIEKDIEALKAIKTFTYSPDRITYGLGAIQHRHVLDAAAWLLTNRPTLQRILIDLHPIILIDESQDTMKGVLDTLMDIAKKDDNGFALGLLGDHRQRIYTDGHSDLLGLVPDKWARPELQMNHRSQKRIVDLINKIWGAELHGRTQATTGVKQYSRIENTRGVVRIFVGSSTLEPAEKIYKEKQCAAQMAKVNSSSEWLEGGYQMLALEHKLVATRGNFLQVYEAMFLIDSNTAAPQGSGENKGPTAVRLLLDELAQLAVCVRTDGTINEFAATEVLQLNRCLDRLPEDAKIRNIRTEEMLMAISSFAEASIKEGATVKEVLKPIIDAKIFEVDGRLLSSYADDSTAPTAPPPRKKELTENRIRRGWCALFASPWEELARYRKYLNGESDLATHQVVKGSEFDHVMVVMDDSQAGGSQISYDKLFGAKGLSDSDQKNIKSGKETTIDRSLRLLYVTCSRARDSLALVLWSEQPDIALQHIKESEWFKAEEIYQLF